MPTPLEVIDTPVLSHIINKVFINFNKGAKMDCLYCGEFMLAINEGGLGEFFICMNPSCPDFHSRPCDKINADVDNVKKNSRKYPDQKDDNDDNTTAS